VPYPAAARIEPGLETAVKWKWWVAPSNEKDWGLPLPEPEAPKSPGGAPGAPAGPRPDRYEVKKGDALILIAKRFGMRVDQLKTFNELSNDMIRIGQTLKIPTLEELKAMAPPPEPEKKPVEKKKKAVEAPKEELGFDTLRELENLLLQVFLDREQFSPGPIDGKSGPTFVKVLQLYQSTHEDVRDDVALKHKAQSTVGEPFTHYTLRPEDFRFIQPPKLEKPVSKSKARQTAPAAPPPVTYEDLVASTFLCYSSPWEFVAERFHCDEAYLRRLNFKIKGTPAAGAEFKVPNVIPFEIEKALDAPLQPAADPQKPVTAAIVEVSRLEILHEGKLVAVMPLASARPGLRGRNSWTVLDAIQHPRMATKQEPREPPAANPATTDPIAVAAPAPVPPLEKEQYLAAGPNNPVGIVWINLAKSKSTDPLPYGLHGTSIPGKMSTLEGIGGLRLANWNIARAVRLLPPGTPLQWKQR